ncbi:MAG: hypothetical protein ACK4PR_02560, partial [Gammaproteobacteria bacterium]
NCDSDTSSYLEKNNASSNALVVSSLTKEQKLIKSLHDILLTYRDKVAKRKIKVTSPKRLLAADNLSKALDKLYSAPADELQKEYTDEKALKQHLTKLCAETSKPFLGGELITTLKKMQNTLSVSSDNVMKNIKNNRVSCF